MSFKFERLDRWHQNETRLNILRRTAKEIRSYQVQKKILCTALAAIVLLTTVLYITAALYKNTGSFTVGVDKVDVTRYGLTLSETKDMAYATSHLNAKVYELITNISTESGPGHGCRYRSEDRRPAHTRSGIRPRWERR